VIAKYPDFFTAAVVRNPVISSGEISNSDIPDWFFSEFGLPFEPGSIMTPAIYEKLYNASPIAHVDTIRTPLLILSGVEDQRVAPSQPIGLYHALKARGRDVEMLSFEGEAHPLDGVEAARINFMAGRDWFIQKRRML
jgi:dipeptidyl aminopeptidase/acylaminoacyl peptidase